MPHFLTVTNLNCRIGRKCILEDISCEVQRGEMISIVGPNGAGKSTFLRAIMGILPAGSGTVTLGGQAVAHLSRKEIARAVAYVPQVAQQLFPFTVRHFVQMARYPHLSAWAGLAAEDVAFCEDVLAQTSMTEFAERTLDTLSGGELQRVWIAGAMAQSAEMLLLDEAVSQMDYRYQNQTAALLCRLNLEQGKTVLQVTHDVNRAALESRRILAFSAGRLVFDGSPREFMTPQVLEAVYGVPLALMAVPELDFPLVVPQMGVENE